MSPCTSGGYMDPRTGQCNCDQGFVSEVDKKINHAKNKAKKVIFILLSIELKPL